MDVDALEVIRRAERIVYVAGWRWQEEIVLQRLAGTRGVAHAPLEPRSDVIQLVTYDGEHLGHVRLDGRRGPGERWVAVLKDQGQPVGTYDSAEAAAEALAQALGKKIRKGR
jgi:hypothetical protein